MGLRQRLNQNGGLVTGVITAVVLLATVFAVVQVMASRRKIQAKLPDSFYTTDDGKTFFKANSENVPPFDYNGKQAVTAYVFECNGKRFVGYLERYTPEARKAMLENKATPQTQIYGRELKKPGDATWVKSGDGEAIAKVLDVHPPDGISGSPEQVEP